MGVFLHHPTTDATIETIDGPDGEAQAVMYESLGWARVDAERPAFGDGPPVLTEPDATIDGDETAAVEIEDMSDEALVDRATDLEIDLPVEATRDDIIAAIKAHQED